MANQLQATVYQIGATQQDSALTMTFPTSKIVISEAVLPTISAVNARIDLYSNPNSKQLYVSYYVAETVADLLTAANTGGTSMFGATVASINLSPFRTTVDYAFPVNGVSLWPYVSGTVNSFVNFMGTKYYATETVATLETAANVSSGGDPTEWLYVSSPVNKVFRLDGTLNGKSKWTDPNDATNYVAANVEDTGYWYIVVNNDFQAGWFQISDTDYPQSGGWLLYSESSPASISITRYTGTLQEVLEAISKPKEWPKVYRALLTQSGTDAPVATVLENTLGGEVVWTRGGGGYYVGTLASAFTSDKTFVMLSVPNGDNNSNSCIALGGVETNNTVSVYTADPAGSASDGILYKNAIEILVYP